MPSIKYTRVRFARNKGSRQQLMPVSLDQLGALLNAGFRVTSRAHGLRVLA